MVDKTAVLKVKSFESLVEFLVDELGWRIEIDKFDNLDLLGYDFTPEELGLKEEHAAQIREIKQLRPIAGEPWGIFWIDFEPRKLHITALRRVLSKFVTKKRANHSDHATWDTEDLLFITAQGEDAQRGITFAHFHRDSDNKEVIRDFSWDQAETHFHYIAGEYLENLRWPEPGTTTDKWREKWLGAFTGSTRKAIRTSKELAERMATLARDMRRRVEDVFEIEADDGPLHLLFDSFKKVLIHDLDTPSFADMYAQTVTYGLFSARCMDDDGHFELGEVVERIPKTNPFLKDLFKACFKTAEGDNGSIDLDELGVNRIVELLDSLNEDDGTDQMQRILQEFGRQTHGEDPVIHFYEGFLNAYEQEQKKRRGVYYTPDPVVSFIVRSVDEMLREKFGLSLGLADTSTWGELVDKGTIKRPELMNHNSNEWRELSEQPFVQILDPATGTGTFLKHVIELVHKTMRGVWKQEGRSSDEQKNAWNDYVSNDLLPRLNGFELMMAPYAVCHMKLGLVLQHTGYEFGDGQRLKVFLTNTLERPHTYSGLPLFGAFIGQESEEANKIKLNTPITVVIGNPPYAGLSANLTPELRKVIDPYRFVGDEKIKERGALQFEKNLQDDYVKFFCWSEQLLKDSGLGILALITNNGFLETPTLRGMRWHLIDSFDLAYLIDLHGSVKRPLPGDKNVFDIQQGVSISLFLANSIKSKAGIGCYRLDITGLREQKYKLLSRNALSDMEYEIIEPAKPLFQFIRTDKDIRQEYETFVGLLTIMPFYSSGTETGYDDLLVGFTQDELRHRIENFLDSDKSDLEIAEKFSARKGTAKKLLDIRESFRSDYYNRGESHLNSGMYRVFDRRWYYYNRPYFKTNSFNVMRHLVEHENIALVAFRQQSQQGFQHVFVCNELGDKNAVSLRTREINYYFPLYIWPNKDLLEGSDEARSVNFSSVPKAFENDDRDFFCYIYAVLHSQSYRTRYEDFLKSDFPRIPISVSPKIAFELSSFGEKLIDLHLMKPSKLDPPITTVVRNGEFRVKKVSYSNNTVWLDEAKTNGFKGVPEEVWCSYVGGYQVCHKWLKDRGPKKGRPGRILTNDDIDHYQKIIVALNETIHIMAKIDGVIEEHGGWPDAFVSEQMTE